MALKSGTVLGQGTRKKSSLKSGDIIGQIDISSTLNRLRENRVSSIATEYSYGKWWDEETRREYSTELGQYLADIKTAQEYYESFGDKGKELSGGYDWSSAYDSATSLKSLVDAEEYWAQFSDQEDYTKFVDMGWLNPNAESNEDTVSKRRAQYQSNANRIEEIKKELPWNAIYFSEYAGVNLFLTDEQKALKKELEALEAENLQYKRTQGGLDEYYVPITDEFTQNAAYRDYQNATREELQAYDMSSEAATVALNNGGYYDENGNVCDRKGNIVQYATAPKVEDKLGLFLAATEEDITEAYHQMMNFNSRDAFTWERLISEGDQGGWKELSEHEINIYYDLYKREGQAAAYKFLSVMKTELNRRQTQKTTEYIKNASVPEQIALNLASIPMSVLGGIPALFEDGVNVIQGNDINPYSNAHAFLNAGRAVREKTAEDINKLTGNLALPYVGTTFGDVYQSIMSFADSALASYIPGGHVLLGMNAASAEMKDLYERGGTTGQILAGGFLSGAAEMFFEKFSIGELKKLKNMDKKAVKSFADGFVRTVVMGGVEASEEMATEIANTISDALVMGTQSDWVDMETFVKNVANAGIGGFISGGLGGSFAAKINNSQYEKMNVSIGKEAMAQENFQAEFQGVLAQALQMPQNSEAYHLAVAAQKKLAGGKQLSEAEVGALYRETAVEAVKAENNAAESQGKVVEAASENQYRKLWVQGAYLQKNEDVTRSPAEGQAANHETNAQSAIVSPSSNNSIYETAIIVNTEGGGSLAYGAPAEGEAIRKDTGEVVSIKGIAEVKDGKMTLVLDDGSTVDAGDVEYATRDEALIYAAVANMNISGEGATTLVQGFKPEGGMTASVYAKAIEEAYNYGNLGAKYEDVSNGVFAIELDEVTRKYAYNLGRIALESQKPSGYNNNTTKTEGADDGTGEGLHLRRGIQRTNGASAGRQVSRVEEAPGGVQERNQTGRSEGDRSNPAEDEGRVNAKGLGIHGGTGKANLQKVDANYSADTKAAVAEAVEHGLETVFFIGGNLYIEDGGEIIEARACIVGKKLYVRADHPSVTALQLVKHELTHDKIDSGLIDTTKVYDLMVKHYGEAKVKDIIAEYAKAYDMGDTSVDKVAQAVFVEIVCDSEAGMNYFDLETKTGAAGFMENTRYATQADMNSRDTRGPPADGNVRLSREYWRPSLTNAEWSLLNRTMDKEIETSDKYIDKATKWLYASSKGDSVFAIYGIGDGTVPTPLYAVGRKNAAAYQKKLTDYLQGVKNGTYKTGINFGRWLRIIPDKQGEQGVSVYANGNRVAAKGNDLVSSGTRTSNGAGNTGSSQKNRNQKVKLSREQTKGGIKNDTGRTQGSFEETENSISRNDRQRADGRNDRGNGTGVPRNQGKIWGELPEKVQGRIVSSVSKAVNNSSNYGEVRFLLSRLIDKPVFDMTLKDKEQAIAILAQKIYADVLIHPAVAEQNWSILGADIGKLVSEIRQTSEDTGIRYSREYSYEWFIQKPDMPVTTLDGKVPNNRADVVHQAKQNAAKVGRFDPKTGSVSVYVDDVGADVTMSTGGLRHGLDRRFSVLAPVTLKAGEILHNSIRVNEMNPKNENAKESYVLIGVAQNKKSELYIVQSVINRFKNELASMDVLYAINTKKEEPAGRLAPQGTPSNNGFLSGSTISISQLLEYVNQYFPDVLPEGVLKHYGYDSRPEGNLGDSILYSREQKQEVNLYGQKGKAEDHASFIRRVHEGSRGSRQVGNITYAFHKLRVLDASNAAAEAREELQRLGIKCFLHNGLEYNQDGYTYQDWGNAATLADGSVAVYGKSYGNGIELAGHEAFHVWKQSAERVAYVETLRNNIDIVSSVYGIRQADTVLGEYFGGDVKALASKEAKAQFLEELYALLSGKIHSGAYEDDLRTMFKDYDAVKAAWKKLVQSRSGVKFSREFIQGQMELKEKVNKALTKENERLKEDNQYLKELVKLQRTITNGTKFTRTSVEAAAKMLKKKANVKSNANTKELAMLLEDFYDYIAKGEELEWESVIEAAQPAVDWLKSYERETDAFAQKASDTDEGWGYTKEMAERELLYDVYDSYWSVSTLHTVADVKQKEINQLKGKHSRKMAELKTDHEKQVREWKDYYLKRIEKLRKEYRERAEKKQKALVDKYQRSRKSAIDSRNRTAMRHKIKGVVKDIDKLLNRGNKDRNVKKGLEETISKALAVADVLFSPTPSNAEVLSAGITDMSAAEEAAVKDFLGLVEKRDALTEQIARIRKAVEMSEDYAVEWNKAQPQILALQSERDSVKEQINKLSRQVDPVIERARRKIEDTTTVDIALQDLANAYKELENTAVKYLQGAYDDFTYEYILILKDELKGVKLKNMDGEQLKQVYDMFKMMRTTIRDANKVFLNGKKQERSALGYSTVDEITMSGKKAKDNRSDMLEAVRKFGWNALTIDTVLEIINSDTLKKCVADIKDAQGVYFRDMEDAKNFYAKVAKETGYFGWDTKAMEEFTASDGKTFSINLEGKMLLYAYAKRQQALSHLKGKGFSLRGAKAQGKVGTNTVTDNTTYIMMADKITEVTDTLTKEQKQYVEQLQEYLSKTMGAKGNEVSDYLYGIDLFVEEYYVPLLTDSQFLDPKDADKNRKGVTGFRRKNSGFTKAVVKNAEKAIILGSFTEVWSGHVLEMANYHSMVIPMETFEKVLSFHDDVASVRGTIEHYWGKEAYQYFRDYLDDLNGGIQTDNQGGLADKLTSVNKMTAVALSASVVVQQPTAVFRAMAEIDPKYFLIAPKKPNYEQLKQYSNIAGIKQMGGFDARTSRSSSSWLTAQEFDGIVNKAKGLLADKDYRQEAYFWAARKADEVTWCWIWGAVIRETKAKHPGLPVGSKAFMETAGKRFDDVVSRTQVYDSVVSKSGLMRSSNERTKMATAFMAEPTVAINNLVYGVAKGKHMGGMAGAMFFARTATAVVTAQIAASLAKAFIQAARDDDDDETYLEKYRQAMSENMVTEVLLMIPSSIPFLRDIVTMEQGWGVERTDMALIGDLIDAVKGWDSERKTTEEKIEKTAYALANLLGIPLRNVMRDLKALVNFFNTIYR